MIHMILVHNVYKAASDFDVTEAIHKDILNGPPEVTKLQFV